MKPETRAKFRKINEQYEQLFTSTPVRYTGAFGDIDTSIQFTQTPVQTTKVAVPNYSTEMRNQLTDKMDELIDSGVLMTPEEVGVAVEYISPSLVVPKAEKGAFRLVTNFSSLNKFIKRCSSLGQPYHPGGKV